MVFKAIVRRDRVGQARVGQGRVGQGRLSLFSIDRKTCIDRKKTLESSFRQPPFGDGFIPSILDA